MRGPIDEVTGMVINVADLKIMIQKVVMNTFDHKNVDLDVPVFRYHTLLPKHFLLYPHLHTLPYLTLPYLT